MGAYGAAPDWFSQLALALSALLALARSVVSARCIGTSFVGSFFDPRPTPPPPPPPPPPPLLHPPATSLAEIQAAHSGNMLNSSVYHQPTPPPPAPAPDKQPPASAFAIYAHNSRRYLLEASEWRRRAFKRTGAVVLPATGREPHRPVHRHACVCVCVI